MMVEESRALAVAINSLRFNPDLCDTEVQSYEIALANMRNRMQEETGLTPEEIAELARVKEERDAAIEDIPHTCEYCAYNGVDADAAPCADCERMNTLFGEERWEWRGTKEG